MQGKREETRRYVQMQLADQYPDLGMRTTARARARRQEADPFQSAGVDASREREHDRRHARDSWAGFRGIGGRIR